jgi:hypothetical protein
LKKSNFSFYVRYYQFEGITNIRFSTGTVIDVDGLGIDAIGYNGVANRKLDLGIKYKAINWKSIFLIKLNSGIGFQKSKKNGSDFYSGLFKINGPDYFETMPIYAEAKSSFQLIPTLGIELSFIAFKKIEFSIHTQGFYGFVPYQSMYFNYTYKGLSQNKAVFDASGTGIYFGVGLGYKLF